MKPFILFLPIFTMLTGGLMAKNLAPNIANYRIDVRLNADRKELSGYQQLVWTNTSPVSVKTLQFHLYMNAFKNKESTFMKESGGN